jgi:hypothetical protein
MDTNLVIILVLTFVIHIIGTLSYSSRIAGVRTRKIAVSLSIFNILVLVSRLSNSFQGPLLAKRVEEHIISGLGTIPVWDFRIILFSASLATIVGALLIPTTQRLFTKAISRFSIERSVPRLLLYSFSKTGLSQFRESLTAPKPHNINLHLRKRPAGLIPILLLNIFGTGIWTVAVLSSLFAGYLIPELRVTASSLAAIINGLATLMMFIFVDPYLSLVTDEAVAGKVSNSTFRKIIVDFTTSRFVGTVLAQFLLIPSAKFIAFFARVL